MRQWRTSGQPYQSAWREWDNNVAIPDQILNYMEHTHWVYDCDTCGGATMQFVVRDNHVDTYWQVNHAWWIELEPEWCVQNEFDIERIESVNFGYPRINRDWLKLT